MPNSIPETICKTRTGSVMNEPDQLNNLNELAASFPFVIQKLLLFLPAADLISIRQCTKSLKCAVDQYVGLSFCLSEPNPGYHLSPNVKVITGDMLNSFRNLGIRNLTAQNIIDTTFSDLFSFPDLLQRLHIVGTFDSQTLLEILTECCNLQELKLHEEQNIFKYNEQYTYKYDELFDSDIVDFMNGIHEQGRIHMVNLKILHMHWKGVSTMNNFFVPLPIYCPLVTGTLAKFMDSVANTLKAFSFAVEGGGFPEDYCTTSINKLDSWLSFLTDHRALLPSFQELVSKLYFWDDEREIPEHERSEDEIREIRKRQINERDQWLQELMENLGKKMKLTSLRLEIDMMEEFGVNWLHFTKHQKSLQHLTLQSSWFFPLVQEVLKAIARELRSLALVMQFINTMDMEDVLGSCSQLKYLHLNNSSCGIRSDTPLAMRVSGHIVNAKFDQFLPNLEGLVLYDVLIKCGDMARLKYLDHLKYLVYSFKGGNHCFRSTDPNELFGITFDDFKLMLFKRNLDYLVLTDDSVVLHGLEHKMDEDEKSLNELLEEEMFHLFNLWGPLIMVDKAHIAVMHGQPISQSHWFYPFVKRVFN
ncbi:hypothetical protein Ocin01_18114 [Orchesella cincta]|uniref:F-box domain-containing protein n=1 Tax=Orchesella cincta TaxID=48709 RepID=A0A1D2M6H2_ORCCI|nr:hypothetical protein Ocin01_18114 [Orchesella cincta]